MTEDRIRLTKHVKAAGWAAKIGPGDLDQILRELPLISHPNLLVGIDRLDDAGVYRLSDDIALVQTIDFFTPIVDDPFSFGQIAAANALSDVYAMGGKPLTAMNVVAFPIKKMDRNILKEILRGGLSKVQESGAFLVGGHSIDDDDIKYGLSVTGVVHPDKILTNANAHPGDRLILTKPLGTGIIATALKGGVASEEALTIITESMTTLNRMASEVMLEIGVNACTDITGFGLLGHALEVAMASDVGIAITSNSVPIFPGAEEYASMGMVPGGTRRNREFGSCRMELAGTIPDTIMDILYDAQTSGGLLIFVEEEKVQSLLEQLHSKGLRQAAMVGEVRKDPKGTIVLVWGFPHLNVKMGLHYLSEVLPRVGDLNLALSAYNFCLRCVRERSKTRQKLPLASRTRPLKASGEFRHQSRGR